MPKRITRDVVEEKSNKLVPIVTAVVVIGILAVLGYIFFSKSSMDDVWIKEANIKDKSLWETVETKKIGILAATTSTDSTDSTKGASKGSAGDSIAPDSTVVKVVDSVATKQKAQANLQAEIDKMRAQYRERRKALLNEAAGFLKGTPSERAVNLKAESFRKLGQELKSKTFPKPSSADEGKLWDEQKRELDNTANFCAQLGDRLSATGGDERKMKIAALELESKSVD
jgi:hypothetical protein